MCLHVWVCVAEQQIFAKSCLSFSVFFVYLLGVTCSKMYCSCCLSMTSKFKHANGITESGLNLCPKASFFLSSPECWSISLSTQWLDLLSSWKHLRKFKLHIRFTAFAILENTALGQCCGSNTRVFLQPVSWHNPYLQYQGRVRTWKSAEEPGTIKRGGTRKLIRRERAKRVVRGRKQKQQWHSETRQQLGRRQDPRGQADSAPF